MNDAEETDFYDNYKGIEVPYYTKADEYVSCIKCKKVMQNWEMGKNKWGKYYNICPECRDKYNKIFNRTEEKLEAGYSKCIMCRKIKPNEEMGINKTSHEISKCCIVCKEKAKQGINKNKIDGKKRELKKSYKCEFCNDMKYKYEMNVVDINQVN